MMAFFQTNPIVIIDDEEIVMIDDDEAYMEEMDPGMQFIPLQRSFLTSWSS
jgi:hypothetical protein